MKVFSYQRRSIAHEATAETIVLSDSRVQAALVFGRGKTHIGIIIFPGSDFSAAPADDNASSNFKNLVWYIDLSLETRYHLVIQNIT